MESVLLSNLQIFIMIEFYIMNKFTLQSILKNKNVRKVYSTYMKRDGMGTDKWRSFTYAKGPAIQGFLEGHLQKTARATKKEKGSNFTPPPEGLSTALAL